MREIPSLTPWDCPRFQCRWIPCTACPYLPFILDRIFQVDYRFCLGFGGPLRRGQTRSPSHLRGMQGDDFRYGAGVGGVFPRMNLKNLLVKKKTTVVKQWFDLVIKTYPSDTQQFLKSQKDPFANPVGRISLKGLEALFDEILKGIDRDSVLPHLDPIIRIRAVQDFSPSKAVAFIFDLKVLIRKLIGDELFTDALRPDWLKFEHDIDALALIGFDFYMECREKIFALKADNERTKVYRAFSRAGLLTVDPENSADTFEPG